jgi:hypothetical protein
MRLSSPSPLVSLAAAFQIPISVTRQAAISSACRGAMVTSRTPSTFSAAGHGAPFSSTAGQLARKKKQQKADKRIGRSITQFRYYRIGQHAPTAHLHQHQSYSPLTNSSTNPLLPQPPHNPDAPASPPLSHPLPPPLDHSPRLAALHSQPESAAPDIPRAPIQCHE